MSTPASAELVLADRPVAHQTVVGARGHHRRDGLMPLVALALVVLAVVVAAGWRFSGGRLMVMETSSMCPSACVGSLIADRPLHGRLHTGELITFHPPNSRSETYTHRISQIFPNGMIQTRGMANPNHDPWLITRSDIVGQAAFTVWGLGWVLKALPLLGVGVLAWILSRSRVAPATRRSWDRIWVTALIVIPVRALHPLVRGVVMATTSEAGQPNAVRASVVNTGLLPVSFRPSGQGRAVTVAPSKMGQVSGVVTGHGALAIHDALSLPWIGWVVLGVAVVSPLLGYLWHIVRNNETIDLIEDGHLSPTFTLAIRD